ncbi:hypothetical protein MLD38_027889 [Melastoma candidum]|uniref:Uncharacterized protein n=1 Tax=Melastoma candidum TaxID=119954 RepID=A0ACB9N0Q1_9MYRT|nr:hypothetical protein MLD38_027889 [Melastoma candidum]
MMKGLMPLCWAAVGALAVAASAVALGFVLNPSGRHTPQHQQQHKDNDREGPSARPQCPYDPTKRKG